MKAGDKIKIEGVEVTLLRAVHDGDIDPKTKQVLTNPQRSKWWAETESKERVLVCLDGL